MSRSHIGSIAPVAEHAQAVREVARRQAAAFARGRARRPGRSRTAVARATARGTRRRRRARPTPRALRRRRCVLDARGVVVDAGGRADEHERRHELGPVEREAQREAAAHRVADVHRALALHPDRDRGRRRTCPASGTSSATTSHDSSSTRRTPRHDADVCVKPGTSTTRGRCELIRELWRGERPRCDDLVRADARRRVGPVRDHRRGGVAGQPEHAADARARARRAAPGRRRARRTLGRIPRARHRPGDGSARDRVLHVGDRGGEPASRGRRGASRPGAVARLHRRPPGGAARLGRGPDHRPGAPLRRRGALVPRSGTARASPATPPDANARWRALACRAAAHASGPPAGSGAPEPAVPRAARPDRRAAARRARPRRRRAVDPHRSRHARANRRPPTCARLGRARARASRAGSWSRAGARTSTRPSPSGSRARRVGRSRRSALAAADRAARDLDLRGAAARRGVRARASARLSSCASARRSRARSRNAWLAGVPTVLVDPDDAWLDPQHAAHRTRARRRRRAARGVDRPSSDRARPPTAWFAEWQRRRSAAPEPRSISVLDDDIACEGRIARDVAAAMPDGGALVVASSLPVRALEWCMAPRVGTARAREPRCERHRRLRVDRRRRRERARRARSSRCAAISVCCTTRTACSAASSLPPATFVVVDNDGGGIFSYLPQHELPEFETLFATPQSVDLVAVARAHGVAAERVELADAPEARRGRHRRRPRAGRAGRPRRGPGATRPRVARGRDSPRLIVPPNIDATRSGRTRSADDGGDRDARASDGRRWPAPNRSGECSSTSRSSSSTVVHLDAAARGEVDHAAGSGRALVGVALGAWVAPRRARLDARDAAAEAVARRDRHHAAVRGRDTVEPVGRRQLLRRCTGASSPCTTTIRSRRIRCTSRATRCGATSARCGSARPTSTGSASR